MLFSRMVEPPSFFRTEIASTAIGIGRADGQPGTEAEIHRRSSEQQTEQDAQDDRLDRELRHRLCCRNVRLKPFEGSAMAASILTGAMAAIRARW